ncbi:MAG: HypC/HybG/HupF family hydrogenase formation chaperone [Myxococcota bacterium]
MCLAIPGQLETVSVGPGGLSFGRVRFGAVTQEVCLVYVPEAAPGEWLVVHVGFAIQRLDEVAARRTLDLLGEPLG